MRSYHFCSSISLLAAALSAPVLAQSGSAPVGTIVVAHGGDSTWNSYIRAVARDAKTGGPVEVSFLMGPEASTSRFQDLASKLEAGGVRAIIIVPMLVSSHSGHFEQIRYLAGLTDSLGSVMREHLHHAGIERPRTYVPIRVAPALDDSPALARVLTERAVSLARAPREQALFIVGHGPNSAEDYAAWMENLRRVADSVRAWSGFRDVRVDLVRDDAPAPVRREAVKRVRELIELQNQLTKQEVVVVPALISRGRVSRETIVADLAGLPIRYTGEPLLPHPALARWIEEEVRRRSEVRGPGAEIRR
jgi:sirohydrochlorin ferrochelatase